MMMSSSLKRPGSPTCSQSRQKTEKSDCVTPADAARSADVNCVDVAVMLIKGAVIS